MSFISIHNILAPFTNKVHLTTIVLVALVFAAIRWHGGGVEIDEKEVRKIREPNRVAATERAVATKKKQASTTTATTRAKPKRTRFEIFDKKIQGGQRVDNDDFLDSVISSKKKKTPNSLSKKPASKKDKEAGLDDIERSLGLR